MPMKKEKRDMKPFSENELKRRLIESELHDIWPEWHVLRWLGGGTFGDVYHIWREHFNVRVDSALKVIRIPITNEETGFKRAFSNEVRIMELLRGAPNVVSIEDFYYRRETAHKENGAGEAEEKRINQIQNSDLTMPLSCTGGYGYLYVRMELLNSFRDYQKQKKEFSVQEILKLGMDVCNALMYCEERHIIHRDIKPANLFIDQFGNFKVGDFGVSRITETVHQANTMTGTGTVTYMAPEVFAGERYNNTVDIYALGLILYQLLNGDRLPFLPSHPSRYSIQDLDKANYRRFFGEEVPPIQGIDPNLDRLIRKAISFRPEDRYPAAKDFHRELRCYADRCGIDGEQDLKRMCELQICDSAREKSSSRKGTVTLKKRDTINTVQIEQDDMESLQATSTLEKGRRRESSKNGVGRLYAATAVIAILCVVIAVSFHGTKQGERNNNPEESGVNSDVKDENLLQTKTASEENNQITEEMKRNDATDEDGDTVNIEADFSESKTKASLSDASVEGATNLTQSVDAEAFGKEAAEEKDINTTGVNTADIEMTHVIRFPDKNLKKAVQSVLRIGDREITVSDAQRVTKLSYDGSENSGKEITDLTGIEFFTSLKQLELEHNLIDSLSPLEGLQALEYLDVTDNQIADITPLEKNTSLKVLVIKDNPVPIEAFEIFDKNVMIKK